MPSTYAVCREILRLGEKRNIKDISPMKLIKLAYISHGISLATLNGSLFDDDVIAWPYGPVIISIYEAVNKYGSRFIKPDEFDDVKEDIAADKLKAIECALDIYGEFTASQLSNITHRKDTPWYRTRRNLLNFSNIIPNDDIKDHYKDILRLS